MTASTASAKAMSVAVGMAHPSSSPPTPERCTVTTYRIAGTATPLSAAAIGRTALVRSDRSPTTNSRLSSMPATRKKRASSRSADQAPRVRSRCSAAGPTTVSRRVSYDTNHGLLAHTMASTAAPSSSAPPTVSVRSASATKLASGHDPRDSSRRSLGLPEGSDASDGSGGGGVGIDTGLRWHMSNSVADLYATCTDDPAEHGRETTVFEAIVAKISPRSEVLRLLPHRERRMVGAWCFVDLFGPREAAPDAMHVPPHPHIGLQTVSWLVSGRVRHRDSLGTTADTVPGRVAVMTAGEGICHSEDVESVAGAGQSLHGAQLWVALPESQRHRAREFELHDPAPYLAVGGLRGQVFMGTLGGVRASAQGVTPLLGAELTGTSGTVPLNPAHEYLLVPLAGSATVEGTTCSHGQAMYLGVDRAEVSIELGSTDSSGASSDDSRVLLLGGEPFEEQIVMWWNFVARTHEEIEQAREQWNAVGDPRFGEVSHYPTDERLAAPPLPSVALRPRGRRR